MKYYILRYTCGYPTIEQNFSTENELIRFLAFQTTKAQFSSFYDEADKELYFSIYPAFFYLNGNWYENSYIQNQNLGIHDILFTQSGQLHSKCRSLESGYLCVDETGRHIDLTAYTKDIIAIVSNPDYPIAKQQYRFSKSYYQYFQSRENYSFRKDPVPSTGLSYRNNNHHRHKKMGTCCTGTCI